eukprot:6183400-Pleurochrysis_carterae.AAC.1
MTYTEARPEIEARRKNVDRCGFFPVDTSCRQWVVRTAAWRGQQKLVSSTEPAGHASDAAPARRSGR